MKITKTTAVWAVTGALGLATLGGGAFAVMNTPPSNENRPPIVLDSSTSPGATRTDTQSAPSSDSPTTPPPSTAPASSTAPPRTTAPTKQTTKATTTRKTTRVTTKKPTKRVTTKYTAPAPVSADSPQSADSGD